MVKNANWLIFKFDKLYTTIEVVVFKQALGYAIN